MSFSIGRCKSVVALAIGIACSLAVPCTSAAQAVSGTISGNVADPQGQVLPGATLTIINEANNDPRVTVSDSNGGFQVTNLQPGQYTVTGRDGELPDAGAQGRRPQRRRAPVGRHADAGPRQPRGNRGRRGQGHAGERRRDAAQRPDHGETNRAGAGARPRRDVDHAAPAWRALREHRRFARHELRHFRAERRRCPPRLEQRHRRRRRRQRSRRQQPDGTADQPRRHRRGARAPELVPCRVRACRRRPGTNRQQVRDLELSRQSLLLRPQRGAQRHGLLRQSRQRHQAALPLQHLRRQPRGPGSEAREEALFLLFARGAARQPSRTAAQLDDADRMPRCRGISRKRSTARAG